MADAKKLTIRNMGRRNLVIGPPPRSTNTSRHKAIKFDTVDDDNAKVPAEKRLGRTHVVEDVQLVKLIREHPLFKDGGAEFLGFRVG